MRAGLTALLFLVALYFQPECYGQLWQKYSDTAKKFSEERNTEASLVYYTKAKELISRDSIYTNSYLRLCRSIANIYVSEEEYEKALPLFQELKTISEKMNGKDAAYASVLNVLASLNNMIGENKIAESFHLEAKNIRQQLFGKTDSFYAQSCNNLGSLYWSTGQYDKAEPLMLEAKAIREKMPPEKKNPVYAITCTNLANLYRDMGQYDKAEALYIEAKDIRASLPPVKQNLVYASSCNILADLYYLQSNYALAEPLYLEAKEIREKKNKNSYVYGQSCNNLSALYRDLGEYDKAEQLLLEAKAIYEKTLPEGHPSLTININTLGELYFQKGEYKKAETYFLQARDLWANTLGKDHPYYNLNTSALAHLYWRMGEVNKANEFYLAAAKAGFGRISKIFEFTSEQEKSAYLKNINGTSDEYFSFYYKEMNRKNAEQPFVLSLLSRNLILSSTRQLRNIIYNSGNTALQNKFEEWTSLKQSIARLYSDPANTNPDILKKLEEKANLLEKELSRTSTAFEKAQQHTVDINDMQRKLKSDEAAIQFLDFQFNDGKRWTDSTLYVAMILRKDKQPVMVPLFEKRELKQLFKTTGNSEKTANITALYSRGATEEVNQQDIKHMYDLVWKPMERELENVKTIYFAPAGDLYRVAFSALPISKKEVVSDRYRLVQLNATQSIATQAINTVAPGYNVKLFGGVQYNVDTATSSEAIDKATARALGRSLSGDVSRGESWSFLPGTKKEVENIKKLADHNNISAQIAEGTKASEASVKLLNGKLSPTVLHIATHGFFFPDTRETRSQNTNTAGKVFKQSDDPLFRSGLLFAGANNTWQGKSVKGIEDGILTAYEVSNLYFPNTRLVVLSACETALGDIQGSEGVYGLQRAFKMAGVQNLVMSLWKVPDAETAEFMKVFYSNLFAKKSIDESFRIAQTIMKNKYHADPYKWAAWVLVR